MKKTIDTKEYNLMHLNLNETFKNDRPKYYKDIINLTKTTLDVTADDEVIEQLERIQYLYKLNKEREEELREERNILEAMVLILQNSDCYKNSEKNNISKTT